MAIRDNREYRTMPMVEVRKEGEDKSSFLVEGYASTFEEYVLFTDENGTEYKEKILPEAFDGTDFSDVVFLKDHQGTVFARTKNGTLELSIDDKGLFTKTDLSKTSTSRTMFEEIEAGMYTQMSFAFVVDDDEYNTKEHLRTIRHISKLHDVSAVSFPANPTTDISVATRSRFDGFIEQEKAERLAREQRIKLLRAKYEYVKEQGHGN
jgi:HK97 family phage prohead protease